MLDLKDGSRYDIFAVKTYEELVQFFTRTCHQEFEKSGVEIGIPWTKFAFEEPFQILDLYVPLYISPYISLYTT
jgi:hypothetical protein